MAMIYGDDPSCGIKKRVFHAGKGNLSDFPNDTKVKIHYQTRKCDDDKTVLEDSRKLGTKKPLEIIIGKQFKLEVWEKSIKTMRRGEVASFTVDESLLGTYPLVAKSLRDIAKGNGAHTGHCCGMTLKEHGLGYPDLDELMKKPEPLEFILECVSIEEPGDFDYKKEAWAMNEREKEKAIPKLKLEGNELFKTKDYSGAADKYAEAIGMIEQLLLKEKPHDTEWDELDHQKIPFLLNFSQCKLFQGDYYAVIEHCTEVLNKDKDNVKALFRRAKAHVGAWNPEDAKKDFRRAAEIDPALSKSVQKEMKDLEALERKKTEDDKVKMAGLFR